MGLHNIFSVPIYTHLVPKFIADKMEEIITPKLSLLEDRGKMRSDFFLTKNIVSSQEISPFIQHINQIVSKYEEITQIDTGTLQEYWIQDYKTHQFHGKHVHPLSKISGTYYIRANKNAGFLEFQHPSPVIVHNTIYKDDIEREFYKIKPKKGMLILFPPWVVHQVCPSPNPDCIRTSFSFNYN